jgi:hypothetical protein
MEPADMRYVRWLLAHDEAWVNLRGYLSRLEIVLAAAEVDGKQFGHLHLPARRPVAARARLRHDNVVGATESVLGRVS